MILIPMNNLAGLGRLTGEAEIKFCGYWLPAPQCTTYNGPLSAWMCTLQRCLWTWNLPRKFLCPCRMQVPALSHLDSQQGGWMALDSMGSCMLSFFHGLVSSQTLWGMSMLKAPQGEQLQLPNHRCLESIDLGNGRPRTCRLPVANYVVVNKLNPLFF